MTRFHFLLVGTLLIFSATSAAAFDRIRIEEVARAYAAAQPGLETYRADVESKNLQDLLERLAATRAPDTPRPAGLVLRRYWSRAHAKSVVQVEGKNVFSEMEKAAVRFALENIVDLRTFFLPLRTTKTRKRLFKTADVKAHETELNGSRTLHIELVFPEPTNLRRAFYNTGLDLPQSSVKTLTLEIDPDLKILNRLEITLADGDQRDVEVRHEKLPKGGFLPREIRITTPSGSIDDHFVSSFEDVQGYRLPREHVRTIIRPGLQEKRVILFSNYQLNISLPEDISRRLK